MAKHHFNLPAQQFRDALTLRYKNLCCVRCGAPFDLSHALVCRKSGLVTHRHNEICDTFGDLSSLAWSQVIREPMVKKANLLSRSSILVAERFVRGVWVPQSKALFDIRIIYTDARSYPD